jgi:methylmalonyl-CoA mutase
LDTLNFEDPLHFDEFPPVSTEEWEAVIQKDLKGKNYKEILRWASGEGIEPLPFYRKEKLREFGHPPHAVHVQADWQIVEVIQNKDVKSANRHALHALEQGATGLLFDLPSSAISGKADLQVLLQDIRIEFISIQFAASLSNENLAAWLQKIVEERGLEADTLNVQFRSDEFAKAIHSGNLPALSDCVQHVNSAADWINYCASDNAVYGNAGATIVQQLAFALASGNEYLGMKPDFASQLFFNFSIGPNYFLEIAKFRAFSILWEQVLSEYEITGCSAYLTAETGAWNKTKTDAHNNMIRSTTEAMSAALGGCAAIAVHRYDEHFAEESSFASRIARNAQLILQEESYLNKVADPGAGSYYIEALTDALAKECWALFQKIEQIGGFHACLQSGFIQELVSTSRRQKIDAYREKEKILVGINKYPPEKNDEKSAFHTASSNSAQDNAQSIQTISALNLEAALKNEDFA